MSPRVGVVVPCKNEQATIERCLRSLRAQGPALASVIVVDNGSTDSSPEIARAFADQLLELPGVNVSGMRNAGAQELGEVDVVAFVDADCEVAPDWLANGLRGLDRFDMVGARTFAPQDATWVAARWAAIEKARARSWSYLGSANLLVKRSVFQGLGGFDESLRTGEDVDLGDRLRASGGTMTLLDDLDVVHHGFPPTLRRFLRREWWHTSTPGWYERMSPKSQSLVSLTLAWLVLGVASAAGSAGRKKPLPFAAWAGGSLLGATLLGFATERSVRHSVQDGVLISLWSVVRAGRLAAGIFATRAGVER